MSFAKYYIENGHLKSGNCKSQNKECLVIYDVLRIEKGYPLFIKDHLNRLYEGIEKSGHQLSVNAEELAQKIKQLITAEKRTEGNIKIECSFLHHEIIECHYAIYFIPHFYPAPNLYQSGVECTILNESRSNPSIKVANTPVRLLSNQILEKTKVFETILAKDNIITEGSRSNIFFFKNDQLITAPETMVLAGVMRKKVIETALKLNIQIKYIAINKNDLPLMDAAFLSGTSLRILPVRKIDEHIYSLPHSLITELTEGLYRFFIDRGLGK
ncbi:aminotransferase class IV [Natronoflexus pectinivorans]|uniref:branched-chain-amino-acid transaminase n=1 Tax=Natronoflexus pectinivorans TaxID=682526 RepID=A0A4R2G4U3_9BACT|nr:aminotransferase class IV [Natronoflexus pectinivorans]TCO02708.1 branched-chain amino acid aminotransferase [Natronoflexus pectinivorans]